MRRPAYPKLIAALREYDRNAPDRDHLWSAATNNQKIKSAMIADEAARRVVATVYADEAVGTETNRQAIFEFSIEMLRKRAKTMTSELSPQRQRPQRATGYSS